jgi:hypothetical protein
MSRLVLGDGQTYKFFFRDKPRQGIISEIKAAGISGVKFECRTTPVTHPKSGKYVGLGYYGHALTFLCDEDMIKFKLIFL